MSRIYLLITNLILIMVASCTPAAGISTPNVIQINTPSNPRTIMGVITEIKDRILVEQQPEATIGDKIYFSLSHDIKVYQLINSDLRAVSSNNLEAGQLVEVWTYGIVLESFPSQAEANFIIVHSNDESTDDADALILPNRAPDVSGTITQALNTVLVDKKFVVFITPTTHFLRRSGNTVEAFEARNIKEGQYIEIWTDKIQGNQVIAQVIVVVDE